MFKQFSTPVLAQYLQMAKGELFVVDAGDIFAHYLAAFPPGSNPMYKVRTEHDCVCCKQFIKRLGIVVAIKDNQLITVWDVDVPSPYKEVAAAMATLVRNAEIQSVFRTKESKYGVEHNYGADETRYEHFHGGVATRHFTPSPDTEIGKKNGVFQVLYRGLTELRDQDFEAVLDLINSNGLYRGEQYKEAIISFRHLMRDFKAAGSTKNFAWDNLDNRHGGFRNMAIGNLFVNLAKGDDFDASVRAFEKTVAPENYRRTTAVITQRMIDQAEQTLKELGLTGAIHRRFARISDVSVNDVLFVSNESRGKMKDSISQILASSVKAPSSNGFAKHATPIAVDAFLKDVLPKATSLELLLENRHTGNFVSLTGGDGDERLFPWDNNFAWSYDGDVTDSVKQRVKAAGGNIDAKLRVSLSWFNTDDLDLHCIMPNREHIYFGSKMGILDVDMNAGVLVRNPVENLAFNHLVDGVYRVLVHQYRRRETTDFGFAIEIEHAGVVSQYSYAKGMQTGEQVECFNLTIKHGNLATIEAFVNGGNVSSEKWGVKTETLVPVAAVMNSPNHWGENKSGAKHLIFALTGCENPEPARGIYNEFLRGDLHAHRKVFEVLGAKTKCPSTKDQISGVGFTQARGDTVTVVVDGRRSYAINF